MAKIDQLLLCTCEGSQSVDGETAQAAIGAGNLREVSHLCTRDLDVAEKALASEGTTMIACGQMAGLFEELAASLDADLVTADIRDRAGWTADETAHPKQAALLAEALLETPVTPTKDVLSEGTIMILGGEAALSAAE